MKKAAGLLIVIILLVQISVTFADSSDEISQLKLEEIEPLILSRNAEIYANNWNGYLTTAQRTLLDYTVIWKAQQLYFSYNDFQLQKKELQNRIAFLQEQLKIEEIKKNSGLTSGSDQINLNSQINDTNIQIMNIDRSINKTREKLNLMLGQDTSHDLKIEQPPEPDKNLLLGINYVMDITKGINESLNVKNEELIFNKQSEKKKFELAFKQCYQNVKDRCEDLQIELGKLAETSKKISLYLAEYRQGLCPKSDYLNEKNNYSNQELKVTKAELEVTKAHIAYSWMVRGFIADQSDY
ncbi:MAG: hypothetical protein Q8920_06575 [Bacillota bacterium]|nr:hypothetical protein [Bacillota bacterium]